MSIEALGMTKSVDARGVGVLTIARPEAANSLTPQTRDALADAFVEFSGSPEVRAILLRSTGDRHFCTGASLSPSSAAPAPTEPARRVGDVARMLQQGWQRLIASILDCEKPVVAAVQGTAAGAGASLVLACDLVVMSQTANLVEVFVRRGILPDAGAVHLLTRVVGLRRATELLLLGDAVDAETCERFGIVNRVASPETLAGVADELVGRLAQGPTMSMAMTKKLLLVASESDRNRAFEQEASAQELVAGTHDHGEGIAAFVQRRPPQFRGY
ncbi:MULTISPECIES: enoyl-CoA hydratase/isomerase family protein [unclassified Mycobacterium]|uniref:enoyl-CoA hydratase/isomerase family protein n=1 Tax=unclassified Mycobacterium TaxID=2642494 RepID=UPI0029C83874|nr:MULTISPECIES: enoyl-CoA hydratase-related protein [unclassified Mycobacterium]